MNQNGWLAFNTYREKHLENYNLQKQAFLALNTRHQCFACCSKRICRISIILLHCVECVLTSRPEAQKAGNVKDMEQ